MDRDPIIAVDMDGVVADLHTRWIELYNKDYDDNLTIKDFKVWDITTIVKPKCGKKILNYLHRPELYKHVKPIPGALEGINFLRSSGFRVVFASSCVIGSEASKLRWLLRHKFLKMAGDKDTVKDWIPVSDKSLVAADVLIDDRPENIYTFRGQGIIFTQPYNLDVTGYPRLDSWANIYNFSWAGDIKQYV